VTNGAAPAIGSSVRFVRKIMASSTPSASGNYFKPRRLGHANLFVTDYKRAADFYLDVVGYQEAYRQPDNMASFSSNGNTYHDFALTDVSGKYGGPHQLPGLNHFAVELETERDLVDGYNAAVEDGVEIDFVMDHDVARSVYFTDPEGTMVEVYADVDRNWRENRKGIIIKKKPVWVPGVTSAPLDDPQYVPDPEIDFIKDAVFHGRKVTHVGLVVEKLEAMVDYYTRIVGLKLFAGGPSSSYAILGGTVCDYAVTLFRRHPGLEVGLHHVGIEVWGEDDLKGSLKAAQGRGIEIIKEIDSPARHAVTIKDPDGIHLQFFVDKTWTRDAVSDLDEDTALYLV